MKKNVVGNQQRFRSLLHECDTHAQRIRQAVQKYRQLFPLSSEAYSALTNDKVRIRE